MQQQNSRFTQLEEEVNKRMEEKEKERLDALKPYITEYGDYAANLLEAAFSYFSNFSECETYKRIKTFEIDVKDPEKLYEVIEEINKTNERYKFFLNYKKPGILSNAKVCISTFYTDKVIDGFF